MDLRCPSCNGELVSDEKNPGKVLCYECKKRFDEEQVRDHWESEGKGGSPEDEGTSYRESVTEVISDAPEADAASAAEESAPASVSAATSKPAPAPTPAPASKPRKPASKPRASKTQADPSLPKGLAITSLVLGIVALLGSFVAFFNVITAILGAVGIVVGVISLGRIKAQQATGRGLTLAGIVTAAIGIILSIAITVFSTLIVADVIQEYEGYEVDPTIASILHGFGIGGAVNDVSGAGSGSSHNTSKHHPLKHGEDVEEVTYNDSSSWTEMRFSVDGHEFTLGELTLEDLSATGWNLDLAGAGYEDGYIVEPHQMISTIELANPACEDASFFVNVVNDTDEPRQLGQCQVYKVSFTAYKTDLGGHSFSVGSVAVGDDIDATNEAFGDPQEIYPWEQDDDGYISYEYYTESYDKTLSVTAYENYIISDLALTLL